MGEIAIADKQRMSYQELLYKVIPELLSGLDYVKDNRYKVSFELYPIDSTNAIEENGYVYTILKTFCHIEDLETGESQELVIDLLKIPVYQELGFMIAGNYKQVLDLYDKPAGWSFFKEVKYDKGEPYETNVAKLLSANYKTVAFEADKQAPYFRCDKRYRSKAEKSDRDRVPMSVFFRVLTGYDSNELLELFGYDNPYHTLAFGDNPYMMIDNSKNRALPRTRSACISYMYNCMFGSSDANDKGTEEKLNRIKNWFFKKSYMDLGSGNRKRFNYIQSFKNRALNKVLAEDVKIHGEVLVAGTVLTANTLNKIDNSPVDCIKVEYDGKIHSLHKYSTFTFRALNYFLAEDVQTDKELFRAGRQLSLQDLQVLNESSLDSIKVKENVNASDKVLVLTRNVDGSILTIEDIFTAYSIFANNMNGYNYVSDIDELTDKIVVPFDRKVVSLVTTNINNFINRLNERLDYIKHGDNKIIDALVDFSDVINKNSLLEAVSNVDNTESQLSDINNVISFMAKDFKVTNQGSGNTTTDSLISVHGLQFGRLDPYDSPESGKIGKVHHRTVLAKEDDNGYLLTPYIPVSNGVISDEVEYLSATEEKDVYIAEWNETFVDEQGNKKDRVLARYRGEVCTVATDDVAYKEYSPMQNLSPTTSCIPFLNFTAGKRIQMSDNQQKQAVANVKAERPIVCTGAESLLNAGVYKAADILQKYYDEQLYNFPELETHKDEILHSDLQLVRVSTQSESKKLALLVIAASKLDIDGLCTETYLEFPFAQHTLKSDMFSFRINVENGGFYKCTDIVAYNSAYDMKDYKIGGIQDYGGLEVTPEQLKGSIALGRNFLIGFKTVGSSSIDDGIVISSAIVADDSVTSIMIHKETVELLNSNTRAESFEAPRERSNGKPISYFNMNGLPKKGTYLYPGDAVVYKKITELGAQKVKGRGVSYKASYLGRYVEGHVISADIVKKPNGVFAEVYIACRAHGEVADKMAGRVGNKGVFAKVVPEEFMPYDPVSGKTLEIILNPLGVPSRMNITQLLEVTLAAASAKNDEIAIVSPFHPDSYNFVIEAAKQNDINPLMLIDGKTGKYFERPINVGYQYMYKLVHMARKNIHSVGLQHGVNQVTLQAKSSAKLNGGQSFGEMESWCLESIGAMKVLQELQTTMSDDRNARSELELSLKNDPYNVSIVGENHNDLLMTTLLRLLGTNIVTNVDSNGEAYYEFMPLKDSVIRSLATTNVTKNSLHSIDIFGSNNGISQKMADRDRWGWIDLGTEIVHPTWIEKGELSKLFLTKSPTGSTLASSDDEIKWSRIDNIGKQTLLGNIKDCKTFIRCVENQEMERLYTIDERQYKALDEESKSLYKTGFEAISFIFRHYDMQKSLINLEMKIMKRNSDDSKRELTIAEMKALSNNQSLDEARRFGFEDFVQSLNIKAEDPSDVYDFYNNNETLCALLKHHTVVKEFIDSGSSLTDYLITSYPVMPAIYRPTMPIQGRPTKNDFDVHYEAILNAVEYTKMNDSQSTKLAIYNAICNFIGLSTGVKSKKTYTTVLEWFVGKNQRSSNNKNHGKIRETVQKKIIGRSGRSVIIPSQDPFRSPLQIGLPISMAVVIYEEQLIPHLSSYIVHNDSTYRLTVKDYQALFLAIATDNNVRFREIYNSKFSYSYDIPSASEAKRQFLTWITEFIEGKQLPNGVYEIKPQVVIAGRQPSLHRYSIRAYYPKIVYTKAIQVNSLVCSGYNADFDGDQMWLAALISEDAKEEAMALMSAKSDIVNPKNGEIILTHNQDIALGIYTMTMLKDNALELSDKTVKYHYSNLQLLRADVLDGNVHAYDVVSLEHKGKHFVSTAGRILFNALIPSAFDGEVGSFTNKLGIEIQKPERFTEMLYDGLITTGKAADGKTAYKLSSITKKLYEDLISGDLPITEEELVAIYQDITAIGFLMSERYGVSISIFDFHDISTKSNKKDILFRAEEIQKRIEKDYQDGLLSDTDKARLIKDVYAKAFNNIEDDIFGKEGALERNNNIFIMFDSGARGSKSQIMQSIGAVGKLQKTKDSDLELPVLSNYSEGLTSFDFQMLAYSTRTGMASTQNETKNSGYASRRAEHCSSGLEISELDCGKTDWWYDVEWDKRIDDLTTFTPNKKWFEQNLLGESVNTNDSETMEMFGDTLSDGVITEASFDKLSNGFHRIALQGQEFVADIEMLNGTKPLDEASIKYLKYFTNSGYLTKAALQIIDKRHLRHVETDIGNFEFRYSLSKLSRSLLENREARNLPNLRKYNGPLSRRLKSSMYIITEDTLKWIEESGTERIEARILLDCHAGSSDNGAANKTLHSCCARCYGLKYTTNTLPEVGENIGIEAAQAIGEPAAQLTLSLVNKGGASGESVASGVDVLHKLLDGNNIYTDSRKEIPLVSKRSGYLQVHSLDKKVKVSLVTDTGETLDASSFLHKSNYDKRINAKLLICKDKEWIDAGEAITDGYVLPGSIIRTPENSMKALIRKKQTTWLYNWFKTFDDNNIYVNARHFELFTKTQASDMTVRVSNNPAYKVGKKYKVSDILTAEGNVLATLDINNCKDTILNSSGALAVLSYEDIMGSLPNMAQQRYHSYKNSPTGALNLGENLRTKTKKMIFMRELAASEFNTEDDSDLEAFAFTTAEDDSSLMKLNLFENLDDEDFADLTGDLDLMQAFEPTTETLAVSIEEDDMTELLDDTEATSDDVKPDVSEENSIDMQSMDIFGVTNDDTSNDVIFALLDSETYMPIEGVEVAILKNGSIIANATSDASGNVEFSDIANGSYVVKILSEKYSGDIEKEFTVSSTSINEILSLSYDGDEVIFSTEDTNEESAYSDEYDELYDESDEEDDLNYSKFMESYSKRNTSHVGSSMDIF